MRSRATDAFTRRLKASVAKHCCPGSSLIVKEGSLEMAEKD